ncbi:MAG: hypothetical protein KDE15_02485 [Erythrobacter sp.]|nr:hypothetical protein [Erythrobacter sp.]
MLRKLLTLLAVISGLGLSAQPSLAAQASVVSVAAQVETQACQPVVAHPLMLTSGNAARQRNARPCRPVAVVIVTPTVQLQADRARE